MIGAGAGDLPDLTQDDLAAWETMADGGFIELIGPFHWTTVEGQPVFAVATDQRHRNRTGRVSGGVITSFADRAMGAAARQASAMNATATIQLNMNFVAGAGVGDIVVARPAVARIARDLVFMTCDVVVGQKRIATASGIWKGLAD